MYNAYYTYSEAVNRAASDVLTDYALARPRRVEQLRELLYSLGPTIPESWGTKSRALIAGRERSMDLLVRVLSSEMYVAPDHPRYDVLSGVLLLALTIKQTISQSG